MTEELKLALASVGSMKYPSVASLLRRNRYEYEAQQIERMVKAWEEFKDHESTTDRQEDPLLIQQAIGIIIDLLSTCELNLDEVERETVMAVASANEFLRHVAKRIESGYAEQNRSRS